MSQSEQPDQLTASQMAAVFIATFTGSAIVFIPGAVTKTAGNGAVYSLLISLGFGILVLACMLYLNRVHQDRNFLQYSRELTGKVFGVILALPMLGLLFFAIPGITVGISNFLTSIMMEETPDYVFQSITLFIACLTARAGIQVIGRMFVLLVGLMLGSSLVVILLAVPNYHPGFLLPLWPLEIKQVLHGAFITAGFPYGEVVLFTMILPYARKEKKQHVKRWMFTAQLATGVLLLLSTVSSLMILGPSIETFQYPLYMVASEIQVAEIFQRIESIIGISLILGSYMKATLYIYILNQMLTQLIGASDDRILAYPIALVMILLSFTFFDSPADFYEQVYVIWPFTVVAAGCLPVFLLTAITAVKRRWPSKQKGADGDGQQAV